ncbi:MAG: response regulator [Pseudomonadota bacterium]
MSFKILIVDDDEDIRELLESVAGSYFKEQETAEFFQVSNGLEALNSCFERKYDLVFCDIKMPQMDGLSFLQTLRKSDSKNAEAFVILVSGFMGSVEAKNGQGLENTYLLEKPFSTKSIGTAMNIWKALWLKEMKSLSA